MPQYFHIISSLFIILIDFSIAFCPKDGIPGSIDGSCLFAVKFNQSFENAQVFCQNYYGNLVSIRSSDDNEKIQELGKQFSDLTRFIWLGGTYDGKKITWIDGSPDEFTDLPQGVPAGRLLLNLTSGKWTTSNWNGMFPFVCLSQSQDPSNQPPICPLYSACPSEWVYSQSLRFCYKAIFNVDFTTADQNCRLMGSNLASIHSDEENVFVNDLGKAGVKQPGSAQEPLIGGKRTGPGKTDWVWVDGTPMNYTKWAQTQPDNARNNEYCMQIWPDLNAEVPEEWNPYLYQWNDFPCENRYRVAICKQPAKY